MPCRTRLAHVSIVAALLVAGCARTEAPSPAGRSSPPPPEASFANGGFESDPVGATPPTGWTLLNYLNSTGVRGTTAAPPATFAALNLAGLGTAVNQTSTVGGAAPGQVDPDLGAGQSFRYPAYGDRAVRVNYRDATVNGKNRNANLIRQLMTVGLSDLDPTDGKVHVRFAIAPVLENPSHAYNQQPYYFVELLNLTRATTLYTSFNVAGQAGVPWHTTTSMLTGNAVQWLDWQLVDIAPGNAGLAAGDQVQLTVIASGCVPGGHFGRIYLDGIGAVIPGPFVAASAPQSVNANTTLTYTISYSNGGTSPAIGAHVELVTPPMTTFNSVAGAPLACTETTVGGVGSLFCPLGTLNPGASGSFTITVNVASTATGSIVNGNYSIGAVNATTLLGAKVTTTVISSTTRTADLAVTKTVAATAISAGSTAYSNTAGTPLYTITVTNPSSRNLRNSSGRPVTVTDVVPSTITGVAWTCAASGASSLCRDGGGASLAGTGNSISLSPAISSSGGSITIRVFGTVDAAATGTVTNVARASVGGIVDPNLANNTATATFAVGTPQTLTLTKVGGAANGTLTSAPAGLSCGTVCTGTTATFASGAQVILSAAPVAGTSFTGWSGAGAPADCTGSPAPTTCTVTMDAARDITATFAPKPSVGAPAHLYVYAGDGQFARTTTTFGRALTVLVTDASGTPVAAGTTVTFTPVPVAGASATVGSGTATTSATGLASLAAAANATAGTSTVNATITGVATPASFTLTNVGPATSLGYVNGGTVTEPQLTPISTAFGAPLLAIVKDAAGNIVPGIGVTFSAPASGASATLSNGAIAGATVSAVSDSSGLVSVTATASAVMGSYDVTASAAGVATPASFRLQNVITGAANVFLVGGSPQTTATSSDFASSLVVAVADASGNGVSGAAVTFAAPASGASTTLSNGAPAATSLTVTTDAAGLATVATATANASGGAYLVSATVGALPPATFMLTNDGGQSIQIQQGSPQSATVSSAFAMPLQVLVLDAGGVAVNGAQVVFSAPPSGASATLSATSATTDGSGLASVTATATGLSGSYAVIASTPNAPTSADFLLSNQCTLTSQCAGARPICDPASHICGACAADLQCSARSASTPFCDASGACVGCLTDATCSDPFPICSQATSSCGACATDAQCANRSGATPFCQGTGSCSAGIAIEASAGAHGAITPSGTQVVSSGSSLAFTITPSTSYHVDDVLVDGASVGAVTSFTFDHVAVAHTISAWFAIDTFTLAASAGANGTISPAGVQAVNSGGSQTFTISPSIGYHVAAVLVDGASVGAVTSFTFSNVAAAHTIAASFAVTRYAISVAAGAGGAVTCPALVDHGQMATCTVAPNAGWVLATFTDDGADAYGSALTGSYVITSVTAAHLIAATFTRGAGTACTASGDCQSGHCADGVCCDASCGGQCQACNRAGSAGICGPVTGTPAGGHPSCTGQGSPCGGSCDGATALACSYPVAECRAASCASGTATVAASCDGAGACPGPVTSSCGAYHCGATTCLVTCANDSQCVAGDWCSSGACLPRGNNGGVCTLDAQCSSGHCTDGLCCDGLCGGQCEACNLAGHQGACTPVVGTPVGTRAACASDGTSCAGACHGVITSACTYPTTTCRAPSCAAGTATAPADCDGTGACPAVQRQPCSPYACGATACNGNCLADANCSATAWCSSGVCVDKRPAGASCGGANQCQGGFCTDGVCCDGPCSGQCEACDLAGHLGTCWAVTGAPSGGRSACASDGSACGGSCDGTLHSSCTYPAVACRAASCLGGAATSAALCLTGSCPAPQQASCDLYGCGATACNGDCLVDADCAATAWCSSGVCVDRRAVGTSCAGADQCASGFCTDGVCCDGTCNGQCEACNLAGAVGTCSARIGSPSGARTPCVTDGSACGGVCDGGSRTACAFPASACRAGSCTGGVATLAASCDRAGSCPTIQQQPCAPFVCGLAACAGDCSSDAGCGGTDWCSAGLCIPRILDGQHCGGDGQCRNGHCVDGVCCDDACDGPCEACDVGGHLGQCAPVAGLPHGARAACATDGSACGGRCDGVVRSACSYPAASTTCRAAACGAGTAFPEASCDGSGTCSTTAPGSCGSYACAGASCATACSTASDCAAGLECEGHACVPAGSDPGLRVHGSGGCSSTAGTGLTPLVLLALLWIARVRRRPGRRALLILAVALIWPAPVFASGAIDVLRLQPLGGGLDLLGVASPRVAGHGLLRVELLLDHADRPLRAEGNGVSVDLVRQTTTLSLSSAVGWRNRWELSAVLPMVVATSGRSASAIAPGLVLDSPSTGLGDLRLVPRYFLAETWNVAWGLLVPITVPTATAPYAGQGGATISPRAAAEYRSTSGWRLDANLGVVLRESRRFVDVRQRVAATCGLAGEVPLLVEGLTAFATMTGELGTGWAARPLELLAAVRYRTRSGFEVTVGAGPGLTDGYGTPRYRVLAAAGWAAPGRPAAAPRAQARREAPPEAATAPTPRAPDPAPGLAAAPMSAPAAAPAPGLAAAPAPAPVPASVALPATMAAPAVHRAAAAPVLVAVTRTRLAIKETVTFGASTAVIQTRSLRVLDAVAAELARNPRIGRVVVEGHTDAFGDRTLNLKLSERRAGAVRDYLVTRGVAAGRLQARGLGPDRPVATNATAAGREKNRRVEFVTSE